MRGEEKGNIMGQIAFISSLFPVAASAEQEARLHAHHVPPCVFAIQPSYLKEREDEKDIPKTREGSWE